MSDTERPMKLVNGKPEPLTDAELEQDQQARAQDQPPPPTKEEPHAKRRSK